MNLSAKDLRRAADIRDKIDVAQAELEAILSGKPVKGKPGRKAGASKTATKRVGKKRSAAVKAKMAAAQKKRWAAKKKADKAAAKSGN